MANPEHVAILEMGVKTWNKWRLRESVGENVDLLPVDLSLMDFSGADLREANLQRADLLGAVLYGASLRRANLGLAILQMTNLQRADLIEASFGGTYLHRVDLHKSNVSNATFGGTTLSDIDLSQVKGLLHVQHSSPSTIGIDTMYRSKGNIPHEFLRRAGVPEPFIIKMKALVGAMEPIQLYSCFISYSTKDQGFADRLHTDLQAKNVRCWLATEDLKIGDKFRSRIEESIRGHDKLLLVLSKASLASPWVEDEVESALERERREHRLVLFPIRIDDAVMETDVAWAAHLRQKRHIGEFSRWKDHDAYRKAFQRLIRDLKAEAGKDTATKTPAAATSQNNGSDRFTLNIWREKGEKDRDLTR